MNIVPTLEGGLQIEVEAEKDWLYLSSIAHDALSCEENLASRLGDMITDDLISPDWQEFIVPDLDEEFRSDLSYVADSVSAARYESSKGPCFIWITPEDAGQWYSALNQARLAIEERFHFGDGEDIDPSVLNPGAKAAFVRSQFYCAVQGLLLKYVMR